MSEPGPFRIELTGPAVRDLEQLPAKVLAAVFGFLDGPLAENPDRVTKPLRGKFAGMRSRYVGISYRVLVEVDHDQRTVAVVRVAYRGDAYR